MQKKIEKGSDEHQFWGDVFKFREMFYEPENARDDKYWDSFTAEAGRINEKYKDCAFNRYGFATEMIVLMTKDASKRAKELKGVNK